MRSRARAGALAALTLGFLALAAPAAQAHPLGNFTVNHYDGLHLTPDRVSLLAIIDLAEIPTAQEIGAIATGGSPVPTAAELAGYAASACPDVAADIAVTVGATPVTWTLDESAAETKPGVADLPTLRLTCHLSAPASLGAATTVTVADTYRSDRIGWHEITADGAGIKLVDSPVPQTSVSDELRSYPGDLLSSPLDVRAATLRAEPGTGSTLATGEASPGYADPFTRLVAAADTKLTSLIGPGMTPVIGALAVLLAILLGCGHALLPGHGKTVMAAYLAGRRGSRRDALTVGATVTITHTAGVLVLGVLIGVLNLSFAGEQALRWLGIVSGLLVAGIGLSLLRSALRNRRARARRAHPPVLVSAGARPASEVGHAHPHDEVASAGLERGDHGRGDHAHGDHAHGDHGDHSHGDHGDHGHGDLGDHAHGDHGDHSHGDHAHGPGPDDEAGPEHSHGFGRAHSHGPQEGPGRSGLIGMGIAGGLVPSPSALVVLLASIALNRTVFGVLLVFAYGLGMAGTLTTVGLLLVRVRRRLDRLGASGRRSRVQGRAAALAAVLPVLTAGLVFVVGMALAIRGLISPV